MEQEYVGGSGSRQTPSMETRGQLAVRLRQRSRNALSERSGYHQALQLRRRSVRWLLVGTLCVAILAAIVPSRIIAEGWPKYPPTTASGESAGPRTSEAHRAAAEVTLRGLRIASGGSESPKVAGRVTVLTGGPQNSVGNGRGASLVQPGGTQSVGSARIEGRVVRADTDQEIANAEVSLLAVGGTPSNQLPRQDALAVFTDERGGFVIQDVTPGRYRVTVARNGFVRQEYTEGGLRRSGTVLTVRPGDVIRDLGVRLVPTGTVAGRVVDARNEPQANINVQLLRAAYDAYGNRTFVAALPSVRTNDLGEYRLFWLSPGTYLVRANVARSIVESGLRNPSSGVVLAAGAQKRIDSEFNRNEVVHPGLAGTYYPSAATPATASNVNVRAGEQLAAVDIRLVPEQLWHVRGRLIDVTTGSPSRRASVSLTSLESDGDATFIGSYEPDTGKFEIRDVQPGNYELSVEMLAQNPATTPSRYLRTKLEVRGDVNDLLLPVGPAVRIQGRVVAQGVPLAEIPGVERLSVNLAGIGGGRSVSRPLAADGSFVFELPSADYRLTVTNLPVNAYVRAAHYDRADVLRDEVEVGLTSPESFEIVLALNAGRVSGVLQDRDGQPAAEATVVLVPNARERHELYRTALTDAEGRFGFNGVEPASYRLFGWEELEPYSYFDPEVLGRFETEGVPVVVTESSLVTTTVRLSSYR